METRFHVLGVDLALDGPQEIIAPIAAAYGRFRVSSTGGVPCGRVSLLEEDGSIRSDGRRLALVAGLDPSVQLYQQFLTTLLDRVTSHAVFHAAALVDPRGNAVLLAAPTGHGKSSLTLELVARGYRFLSDDYAPVHLATSTVSPYPRTVSVVPGGTAPLPPAVRAAASDPAATRLFGKTLVDIGRAFGEHALATAPAPLRTVILLAPQGAGPDPLQSHTWFDIAVRLEEAVRIEGELTAVDGVSLLSAFEKEGIRSWRIRVDHDRSPTLALSRILEDDAVVYAEKFWNAEQDFEAAPSAAPVRRREAALLLARELLNRRRASRYLAEHGGDLTGLVLDIAESLRNTSCWHVQVGRFGETADLIERLALGEG